MVDIIDAPCKHEVKKDFISLCFQVSDVALSKTLTVYRVPVSEEAVLSYLARQNCKGNMH